ncbi:MAG: hypothetical protein Q8O36_07110 [Candidatus Omnitrophota bacterium]|nr:hypothetical protein [Candidatus Omnitrophota bacterium]
MKTISRLAVLAVILTALAGCAKERPVKEILATIGNYSIYKEDLVSEAELYHPAYRKTVTKEEMLGDLIKKKIMLMEAQRQGLDKKPEFLKMVQRFWEQSLLRSLLDKKSKEILSSLKGPEEERNKKAAQMMQEWVDSLEKNVKVKINKEALEKIELK